MNRRYVESIYPDVNDAVLVRVDEYTQPDHVELVVGDGFAVLRLDEVRDLASILLGAVNWHNAHRRPPRDANVDFIEHLFGEL